MSKNFVTIFLSLFVLCSPLPWAQHYTFRDFSLEQGLPQSEVNAITDDHLGYLWIGTNGGGLCRFDGRTFDVFDKKAGLPDNVVLSLFQDSRTVLWIATSKGIVRYNGVTMQPVLQQDTTFIGDEFSFMETSDGMVWFVGSLYDHQKALYAIRDDSIIAAASIFKDELEDNIVYHAGAWGRKGIILSTQKGLFTIDNLDIQRDALNKQISTEQQIVIPLLQDRMRRTWMYVVDKHRKATLMSLNTRGELSSVVLPKGFSANHLIKLFEDRDGGLWSSILLEGLIYTKGDVSTFFNQGNGLPNSIIHQIFQDREGNFWFGTMGDGIIRYSNNFFSSFNENNGLTDNLIMRIFEDSNGIKYFCDGRGGLNIFDGTRLRSIADNNLSQVGVLCAFCERPSRQHLFGSNMGLWSFDGFTFKEVSESYGLAKGTSVLSLLQDGDTLIVGTAFQGVLKIVGRNIVKKYHVSNSKLVSNRINHLFFDDQRRLWISTPKGVSVLSNDRIVSYGEKNGLKAPDVFQVAQDKAGNIWIANFTGGLICFDGQKFQHYNSENGLKTDVVYSVLADQSGNIWAGSQLGVDQVIVNSDGGISVINNFSRFDGFVGIENNAGAALCDKYGVLWFGTIKGVVRCIPGERVVNQLPPAVFVDQVNLNSTITNWFAEPFINYYDSIKPWHDVPVGLHLSSDNNHIGFTFDALCYTQPEKVLYQWKLDPVDDDFCPPTAQNSTTYTMLPAGKYKLQVIACNNDGVWNENGDTFEFEVVASWWKRPFVRLFFFLFLGAMALLGFLWHRHQVLNFRQELDVLALSKQQELGKLRSKLSIKDSEIEKYKNLTSQLNQKVELSTTHFAMVKDLYEMICDNLAEVRVVGTIQQLMDNMAKADFFGFGCLNNEADLLVFRYAVHHSGRLPVFNLPSDDASQLPVHCLFAQLSVLVHHWDQEKFQYQKVIRVVSDDLNPCSVMVVPFLLSDATKGVLVVVSESEDAFTDYHFQVLKLTASMLGGYKL